MVGNDLVDLQLARSQSNWRRPGYLRKICSEEEQHMIIMAPEPTTMLWLLWSMKESAYKVLNRNTGKREYNPSGLVCSELKVNQSEATGNVSYGDNVFFVKTEISDQRIYSVAAHTVIAVEGLTSYHMHNTAGYMAKFARATPGYLLQKEISGLPVVVELQTGRNLAASVSHHGRYLAVTYSDSLRLTD